MSKQRRLVPRRKRINQPFGNRWLELLEGRHLLSGVDNLMPALNQPNILAGTAAAFNGAVADFTDTNNPGQTIANLTAFVNWGDGTATFGTVSKDPVTGDFIVSGQHLYAAAGSYQVNAKLEDVPPGTDFNFVDNTATVVANSAVVGAQALLLGEGVAFNGTVASLIEPGSPYAANSFAASVNWGDGTVGPGTVTGSGGAFTVSGMHTYAEDGQYTMTVTAAGTGNNITPAVSGTATATVAEDDIAVTPLPIAVGENQQFKGSVATFTDPSATANDTFTATILWGDNTTSTGNVSGSAGVYTVSGSHT
jgi:hypothetical protein